MKHWYKYGSIIVISLVVVLFVGIMGAPIPAQTAGVEKIITSYGEAEISATPDQAHITFGVEAEASTAQGALEANADKMTKMLSSLKEEGIPDSAIRTSGFSLYPNYEYIREGNKEVRRLTGYRVNNNVNIQTKDLENLGQLIDCTVKAGANVVSGISFSVHDTEKLELEALGLAVKHARNKAEALAKAASGNITGIVTIEEVGSSGFEPLRMEKYMAAADASSTPIEPGQIQLTNRVKVTFSYN